MNSRHPKYLFEKGFITVEIIEGKKSAKISDYEGKLAELPADISAIIETLKVEQKRLFGRNTNRQVFLEGLRSQYKDIIEKGNKPDGSSVAIRDIANQIVKSSKSYKIDEFLVDLSKLAKDGPFEIEGRKLDLQQTKDTNNGMLLYGAAERGYIGFILFKEK
jgi:hypothetical protein